MRKIRAFIPATNGFSFRVLYILPTGCDAVICGARGANSHAKDGARYHVDRQNGRPGDVQGLVESGVFYRHSIKERIAEFRLF